MYSRTRSRHSNTTVGGIHDSGSSPRCNNSRNNRASDRSVLARCLLPRAACVSAGSATCTSNPAAMISSTTYRQPVQPSTAIATGSPSARPATS